MSKWPRPGICRRCEDSPCRYEYRGEGFRCAPRRGWPGFFEVKSRRRLGLGRTVPTIHAMPNNGCGRRKRHGDGWNKIITSCFEIRKACRPGEYGDRACGHERLRASAELWRTTRDDSYRAYFTGMPGNTAPRCGRLVRRREQTPEHWRCGRMPSLAGETTKPKRFAGKCGLLLKSPTGGARRCISTKRGRSAGIPARGRDGRFGRPIGCNLNETLFATIGSFSAAPVCTAMDPRRGTWDWNSTNCTIYPAS